MPHDSKEPELGSSNQKTSSLAGKNAEVGLVSCVNGSVSVELILVMWIFPRSLGVICITDEFSVRMQ